MSVIEACRWSSNSCLPHRLEEPYPQRTKGIATAGPTARPSIPQRCRLPLKCWRDALRRARCLRDSPFASVAVRLTTRPRLSTGPRGWVSHLKQREASVQEEHHDDV